MIDWIKYGLVSILIGIIAVLSAVSYAVFLLLILCIAAVVAMRWVILGAILAYIFVQMGA